MLLILVLLLAVNAGAQSRPDFSGVWRFHRQSSETSGPGPQSLLMLIEYEGNRLIQKQLGTESSGREQRFEFVVDLSGADAMNNMRGLPITMRARWEREVLIVDSSFRPTRPPMEVNIEDRMYLSADGKWLSMDRLIRRKPAEGTASETREKLRFERGNDADLALIRRPERTAGENYANVQVLKAIPASKLTEVMNEFRTALRVDCDHCHVPNKWESDDKPTKLTARRMIAMTEMINRDYMAAQAKVQCNTCHRGRVRPE